MSSQTPSQEAPCQEALGHHADIAREIPATPGGFPHGAWPSPLQAADVAAGAVRRIEPRIAGGWAYWIEERPADRGRGAVVRVRLDEPSARPADVAHTAEADIRTAVHEYGGGAWLPVQAPDGRHFVLGQLHERSPGPAVRRDRKALCRHAVTPEPDIPRGLRYADPGAGAGAARQLRRRRLRSGQRVGARNPQRHRSMRTRQRTGRCAPGRDGHRGGEPVPTSTHRHDPHRTDRRWRISAGITRTCRGITPACISSISVTGSR